MKTRLFITLLLLSTLSFVQAGTESINMGHNVLISKTNGTQIYYTFSQDTAGQAFLEIDIILANTTFTIDLNDELRLLLLNEEVVEIFAKPGMKAKKGGSRYGVLAGSKVGASVKYELTEEDIKKLVDSKVVSITIHATDKRHKQQVNNSKAVKLMKVAAEFRGKIK